MPPGWADSVAGTTGGVAGMCIWFPLDTIKCRLQTRPAEYSNSAVVVARRMVSQEGLASLYRGLLSPALGFGAINSTVFGVKQFATNVVAGPGRHDQGGGGSASASPLPLHKQLAVGAFTGLCSSFVRTPIERVKTVMQVRNQHKTKAPHPNSVACAFALARKHGIRHGLFAGTTSTVSREVPQYLIYFIVYDWVRERTQPLVGDLTSQALAGGCAGASGWVPPIYCIDVIKTKVQSAPKGTYTSMVDCARKSYAAEGVAVFTRGTGVAVLRAFPLHATIFVVYETVMQRLSQWDS